VLLYPNLDATTSKPSWKALGTGAYLVSHAEMIERFDAYLPQGVNRKDSKVSPLFATDLADVAPALIVTADHDPLHDEGEEYMTKLRAANVAVDYIVCPAWFMALPLWLACLTEAEFSSTRQVLHFAKHSNKNART
jgi:acetyl esterase